jgi:hypothetical protein
MGGFVALPVSQPYDPSDRDVLNQYQYGIYGYGQAGSPFALGGPPQGFAPGQNAMTQQPSADIYPGAPMEDIFAANRNIAATTGDVIGGEGAAELGYYSPLQQQFQSAQNVALNNLAQTPGYTPEQASQINVDYSGFNTPADQYARMAGDPNAPASTLQTGQQGVQGTLGGYKSDLASALGGYSSGLRDVTGYGTQDQTAALYAGAGNVRGQVGNLNTGLGTAESGLASGIQGAEDFSMLNRAVNNPALGFDPNQTEQQLTDEDVNNLVAQSATTIRNQYQGAEDLLERQAAHQGNTSPAALEAMRQQLLTQEGSSMGDAMTNARIAALQAQYGRAAGIEQQRLGAAQTRAGMQATAGTTEEAARQAGATTAGLSGVAAAEYAGQAGIGAEQQLTAEALRTLSGETQQKQAAEEALGQARLGAAGTYGQFATGVGQQQVGQTLYAQQLAEQEAAQRAQAIGQMQYGQGTGSAQLTARGAQDVGQTQIAGQGAYRSGLAQQQGMAQQGGQAAVGHQLGAYGTMTGGLGQAAQSQAGFEVGKPSLGDTAAKQLAGLFGDGGIADRPQVAKLAEKGPEVVIPLGRYRTRRNGFAPEKMAA